VDAVYVRGGDERAAMQRVTFDTSPPNGLLLRIPMIPFVIIGLSISSGFMITAESFVIMMITPKAKKITNREHVEA
jgi:hypothetical protein